MYALQYGTPLWTKTILDHRFVYCQFVYLALLFLLPISCPDCIVDFDLLFRSSFRICGCRFGLSIWTVDLDCRFGLPFWTVDFRLSIWTAVLDCRFRLSIWTAVLDCRFGLSIWTADLDCRFGLSIFDC